MKILLLNPRVDAEHNIAKALQAKGVALLFPYDSTEAFQMLKLHEGIDILVIHREGLDSQARETGIQLVSKIKAEPAYQDLPIILSSAVWGDKECAKHQNTSNGVNAYLKWPFGEKTLIETIEAVLGVQLDQVAASSKSPALPPKSSGVDFSGASAGMVLEAAFEGAEVQDAQKSIHLEAPVLEAEEPGEVIERTGTITGSIALPVLAESLTLLPQEPDLHTLEQKKPSTDLSAVGPTPSAPGSPDLSSGMSFQDIFGKNAHEPTPAPSFEIAPPPALKSQEPSLDPEVAREMGYLFNEKKKGSGKPGSFFDPSLLFSEPVGDAVVPGGAVESPDQATLKKYLLLREQDVAVLSNRLKAAQDQAKEAEQHLAEEKAKNAELTHLAHGQKEKIDDFEKEKLRLASLAESSLEDLKFQIKAKSDKIRSLESALQEGSEAVEHLKDRVKSDIRKIRVREKELENRLELLKKDSEALLGAREVKIVELKRKLDLLEFNMDLLQNQLMKERESAATLRERLAKAAQVVRVAGGMLDSPAASANPSSTTENPNDQSGSLKLDLTEQAS